MLPDSKISQLLGHQIQGLAVAMEQHNGRGKVSKVIHSFADYTGQMIRLGKTAEVQRCFTMAAVLYHNGSALLKNAIESVYIYALSPMMQYQTKNLLPATLRRIRTHHLQTAGV
ncbi:hypothetical protein [Chitinophaga sp. sic0106]|uniref:DUF7674 family protein n=1 Tax=Chitinophaga sp. sic0106 TaxID=2854785 RepID=UPI001C45217B|nr:hypothetical protein [Chitinophaga sp. sic0106]MBV7528550.1 hypothetical protein [Chitinophaga sp. sic0106]